MTNKAVNDILRKLRENPYTLGDVFEFIFQGIATSKDDVYFLYNCTEVDDDYIEGLSKSLNKRVKIEKGLVKPLLKGEDVHRYEMLNSGKFIIFPYKVVAHKAVLYTTSELAKMYPLGFEYLCQCEHELRGREKGRFNNDKWFQYGRNQGIGYGNIPKLVAPEISLGGNYTFDANGHYYSTTTVYGYIKRNNFKESYYTYMAILNSQLCWWFLVNTGTVLANGYYRYKPAYLKPLPVPMIPKEIDAKLTCLVKEILQEEDKTIRTEIEKTINSVIYELYKMGDNEIEMISSC